MSKDVASAAVAVSFTPHELAAVEPIAKEYLIHAIVQGLAPLDDPFERGCAPVIMTGLWSMAHPRKFDTQIESGCLI